MAANMQQTFMTWLETAQARLAVPVSVVRRTDRFIDLRFNGLSPAIRASLTHEIAIAVEYRGRTWDFLAFFEAVPQQTSDGYVCGLCLPTAKVLYTSPEELWCQHMFEPFLEFVNGQLATADAVGLYCSVGHATWARLLRGAPANPPDVVIPIRLNRPSAS